MRKAITIWLAVAPGVPALAEDVFQRPAECQLVATTQLDTCEAENIYFCGAVEGQIVRTEAFDALGLNSVSNDDSARKIVSTEFLGGDGSFWLNYSGDEPVDVIRDGSSVFTGTGEFQAFGLRRPFSASATSVYTGQTVEFAGKSFQLIEDAVSMQLPYPMPEIKGRAVSAFSEDMQLTLSLETSYEGNSTLFQGSKLVELSLPGQPGFGDEHPRFGCDNLSWDQVPEVFGVPS